MTEITRFAQLAVRAADLADRCEAAGALVVVALLREITQEVEEAILGLNAAAKRFMLAKTQLERLEAEAAERPKRRATPVIRARRAFPQHLVLFVDLETRLLEVLRDSLGEQCIKFLSRGLLAPAFEINHGESVAQTKAER
jgi:hypothetical protein